MNEDKHSVIPDIAPFDRNIIQQAFLNLRLSDNFFLLLDG